MLSGVEVCQDMARRCDGTAILMMSGGKDAVASWLQMREHFTRIVPVFCYLVPGLEFQEKYLSYLEEFFGTRIVRMPHPRLYEMLQADTCQHPTVKGLCQMLPRFDFAGVQQAVREDYQIPGAWAAMGVRSADSPLRRLSFIQSGAIRPKTRTFYPVWDWLKADMLEAFRKSGVKLSPEYRVFGRSFDGLDYRFAAPMAQHYPEDWQRVKEFFGLADVSIWRGRYA